VKNRNLPKSTQKPKKTQYHYSSSQVLPWDCQQPLISIIN